MTDEERARSRYFTMNILRLIGVVMVMVGMLVTQQVIAWPEALGYALIVIGLADAFIVPQILARKWRSPGE